MAARAVKELDPARIAKLKTFFARASVATRLLQSRLALPLSYPYNSAMLSEEAAAHGSSWDDKEIQKGLAHVTPIVSGMAKVAPLLKAAQALGHYQGGQKRNDVRASVAEEESDIRLDFIRPQRLRGAAYGRGPGYNTTKIGKGFGWDDVSTGTTVDSPAKRFTVDPYVDTPQLHTVQGKKYVSKTKWDKRRSGSQ
mmetsp:Transcript_44854/g.100792  ORF Transcript_44854/g.100792 Transcript_44854/m.100792 type:complete len:196 (-) Transcript_44854:288-875(-)